ncbi:UNVERIFIED_CONTAM: Indole-3-acetaldehyde oxidase, partial [Sesamum calycinum]
MKDGGAERCSVAVAELPSERYGGCGACLVLLSKYNPVLKQIESYTVSSCLTLLCSINGCSVTTSEGLGNSKDGFHPIHQRFAGFHASQCGFCTPGMCMSLFSALANAEKSHCSQASPGVSKLTVSEAEKAITGNLCRCTGYRPIADACKSFAADVDLEDLGINAFWRKGDAKEVKISKLPVYNPQDHTYPYTDVLKDEYKSTRILNVKKYSWYTPVNIEELRNLLHSGIVENGAKIKLVVGNTGDGYYKETEKYDKYIDLRYIPELSVVKKDNSGIEFGAALPISKVIIYLKEEGKSNLSSGAELVFTRIADHMEKIASGFIRNSASLGGNLVMAQRKNFPSDIATLLFAVGASVNMLTGDKQEKITFEEFLYRPPIDPKDVLLGVQIPFLEPTRIHGSVQSNSRLLFETYRVAPRPLGNALPYLNAAFLADIYGDKNGILVNRVQLAFGAYGTKHATRARKVEEYLAGKMLSIRVLDEAVKLVKDAIVSEDGTSHPAYRKSLAVSFLFSFLGELCGGSSKDLNDSLLEQAAKSNKDTNTSPMRNPPLLSSAKQVVEYSKDYHPVGEPMTKVGAAIQASGEAVYVDDIPSPPNCLHGALICSSKPLVRVKGISFDSKPKPTGVAAVISAKDIPNGGENIGGTAFFGSEPLFAGDIARFAGDVIAFVVADTQKHANFAAKTAHVDYDTEGLDPPILTVDEAVKKSSFFDVPPYLSPKEVGDFSKGMAEADHKILSAEINLGSQYYFYMETQTALAVPDEDNCMVVYISIQCPEFAHIAIARCLGIPEHNVRVITRRLGGGFGGKILKAMTVATACALAAHKLRRPVRSYLDRKTDMIIAGGRHPMRITYSVGFKSDGKITALHLDILINAGISEDVSPIMPHGIITALKKYNWGALSFDIKLCKTNHSSKSAMRAPGDVQGSFIAEAILERVASVLSMEVDSVRNINFHTYESLKLFYADAAGDLIEYTLPSVWDKGLWTKVKQATAYALSLIQCDGTEDLVEKVRVVQSDTLSLVQGGMTGGSTSSESSCAAVRQCCNILVERLTSLKKSLQEKMGSVKWNDLILQAHNHSINLAAHSYFVPEGSISYLNYGAVVSQVEINVLTGETSILRTDMIYDCGQSMNPAVDLGQIEGAFVQGLGFFMLEEYLANEDGLMITDSTWTYKIPTLDTIPKQFNVEVLNSGHHQNRILSSKACGEPPLLMAVSVYCAARAAINEARKQLKSWGADEGIDPTFLLDVPATTPVVKQLSGLNTVEIDSGDCRKMGKYSVAMMMMSFLVLCLWLLAAAATEAEYPKYKDPKQPLNMRIKDLMRRMSLEEKIGQMTQIERTLASPRIVKKYFVGSVISAGGSPPPPKASAEDWVNMVNDLQRGALSTRLGIPMIYGIDAIHGHNFVYKATVFPHNVGLGVTRDPVLVKRIGAATALEVRATGIPYTFAPSISVSRDPRWGRCYESYSEDHKIVRTMTEIIPGLQGDIPSHLRKGVPFVAGKTKVAACAKHFVGDGGTVKGIDENNTLIDFHGLLSIHMTPYFDSIIKGVSTVMIAYSSLNGKKMHANHELVTGFLKNKLKFRGFVISDWKGIDRITDPPRANYSYSVQAGVLAGLDMVMLPENFTEFIEHLTYQVKKNIIPMSRIDDAVRRILRVKFVMGLFENPLADLSLANQLGSQEHRELAREAVRKSLVLLKNGKSANQPLVPLSKKVGKVLVAGTHADNLGYQCGGWTVEWQGVQGNDRIV